MGTKLQRTRDFKKVYTYGDGRGRGSNKIPALCLSYLSTGKQRLLAKLMGFLLVSQVQANYLWKLYTSMDPHVSPTWAGRWWIVVKQNKLNTDLPKVNNKIPNGSVGSDLIILNNIQKSLYIRDSAVVHFSNPLTVCLISLILKLILIQQFFCFISLYI